MHQIEPYHRWDAHYSSSADEQSPFYGKEYNYDLYSENIYGYFIDPAWDFIGSETLYIKLLYVDYYKGAAIIEFIGEWNDAINNDIMHLKRNIIEHMVGNDINQFILIGENVMNFHGSDDCYYEEWFEEVDAVFDHGRHGWIAAVNFRDFVVSEMQQYNLDTYINFGGKLDITNWRTMHPNHFYEVVNKIISHRIDLV